MFPTALDSALDRLAFSADVQLQELRAGADPAVVLNELRAILAQLDADTRDVHHLHRQEQGEAIA